MHTRTRTIWLRLTLMGATSVKTKAADNSAVFIKDNGIGKQR